MGRQINETVMLFVSQESKVSVQRTLLLPNTRLRIVETEAVDR